MTVRPDLKKVLIAGEQGKTVNYERAMGYLGILAETSLHVPDIGDYDGLILPGGGDIDPKLFGQLPGGTRFLTRNSTGSSLRFWMPL